MPKTPKPNPARKPPEPSESHAEIDAWMKQIMPALQPIVKHIDATIRKTVPDLRYGIKWRKAYYGVPKHGWIIELVAYDVSVNVVFHGGADFDPPPPLGEAGRSRYVKVKTLDEAKRPELRVWIEQAARTPGWK